MLRKNCFSRRRIRVEVATNVCQPGGEICRVIDDNRSILLQQIRIDRKSLVCFHPSVFNGSMPHGNSTLVVDPGLRLLWNLDGDLQDS